MDQLLESMAPQALLFILVTLRIGAMFATAPPFSGSAIPARVKAPLVVLIAWVAMPLVPGAGRAVAAPGVIEVVLLGLKEVLIGIALGLIVRIMFAAVSYAGMLLDLNAGFAVAQTIDPTSGTTVSVFGKWYTLVATSVFLAIGGAQLLVGGVVRSFELVPPFGAIDVDALILGVTDAAGDLMLVAVQIAAPLLAALIVTDITMGLISRAVPQMNIFIVGIPLKIIVALAGTAILLPAFVTYVDTLTGRVLEDLSAVMRAAGG